MSNATLPRLAEGIVDWNKVFDTPGTGLVAQIEHAHSSEDLQKAFRLILKTLFNREGDEERRSVFTNLVNEILTHAAKSNKSPAAAMADVKVRVAQILHSIKDDRIKRAQKAIAAKARKAELESKQQSTTAPAEGLGFTDRQPDDVHIALPHTHHTPPTSDTVEHAPQSEAPPSTQEQPSSDAVQPDEAPVNEPEKVDPALAKIQQEGDASIGDFDEWLNSSPQQQAVDEYEETGGAEKKSPEDFFADTIAASIMENIAILRGGLTDGGTDNKLLPFILSPAFADRFEKVLREHILPDFTENSYFIISQITNKPRSQWLDTLTGIMADTTQGLMIWERWQIAWRESTQETDLPPSPQDDPKKKGFRGLMTKLLGDDDYLYPEEEMTQEEWEEAAEEARLANERAKKTWSLICEQSGEYLPPHSKDNGLLMSLFRSLDDIDGHIEQFRRFAKDGERAGRDFDAYLPGKDLDLALLCACYRHPDIFMTGEKAMVATFVAGLDRKRGESVLPLCCRFLGTAMGNRFAD